MIYEETEELQKKYGMPEVEEIETFDLLYKKSQAEKIVSGQKKVVFVLFNDYYADLLLDYNVCMWENNMRETADDELLEKLDNYCDPLKMVYNLHLHNSRNTYFLDVEVAVDHGLSLCEDTINFLHENFDCHELDAEYFQFEDDLEDGKVTEDDRPVYFIFEIEKVTNTNIDL